MIHKCAWCGKEIGQAQQEPGPELVSHGICQECAEKVREEMKILAVTVEAETTV